MQIQSQVVRAVLQGAQVVGSWEKTGCVRLEGFLGEVTCELQKDWG